MAHPAHPGTTGLRLTFTSKFFNPTYHTYVVVGKKFDQHLTIKIYITRNTRFAGSWALCALSEIFSLVFWMKLIFHKDILKLPDLQHNWGLGFAQNKYICIWNKTLIYVKKKEELFTTAAALTQRYLYARFSVCCCDLGGLINHNFLP